MFALDFDNAVFDGPPSATVLFEFFGQLVELLVVQRQTCDNRHALALASLGLTTDTYMTIPQRNVIKLFTATGIDRQDT